MIINRWLTPKEETEQRWGGKGTENSEELAHLCKRTVQFQIGIGEDKQLRLLKFEDRNSQRSERECKEEKGRDGISHWEWMRRRRYSRGCMRSPRMTPPIAMRDWRSWRRAELRGMDLPPPQIPHKSFTTWDIFISNRCSILKWNVDDDLSSLIHHFYLILPSDHTSNFDVRSERVIGKSENIPRPHFSLFSLASE